MKALSRRTLVANERSESEGQAIPSTGSWAIARLLLLFAALFIFAACGTASASPTLPEDIQPTTIAVGISPEGERFLILGTLEHGAYVSFNDGIEWTKSEGLPGETIVDWLEPAVMDIEIAPDGRTAFAATIGGLFRSTDSGRSWSELGDQESEESELIAAWEVSVAPNYESTQLVAAIANGWNHGDSVWISGDGGETWGPMLTDSPEDIQLLEDSRVGIATYRKLSVYPALPREPGHIVFASDSVTRATFSPDFANDNMVFVGGAFSGDPFCRMNAETGSCDADSGFYLKAFAWRGNLGINIGSIIFGAPPGSARFAADLPRLLYPGGSQAPVFSAQPHYGPGPHSHSEVVLSPIFPSDGTGLAITTKGLARTTDHGLTWQIVDVPIPDNEDIQAVAFPPAFAESNVVFGVTDRRLLKSTDDGATWDAYPDLDRLPPIPTSTPQPTFTPGPSPTPFPTATAAPTATPWWTRP